MNSIIKYVTKWLDEVWWENAIIIVSLPVMAISLLVIAFYLILR